MDLGGSREPVAADQPCGGADPVPEVNNVIVAEHVSGVGLDGTCVRNGDCAPIVDEMDLGGSRAPVAADQPCGGADPMPEVNNVIVAEHVSGVGLDGTCVGNEDCARIVDEMTIVGGMDGCSRHTSIADIAHDGSFITPVEGVSRVVGTPICAAPLKANRPIRPAPDSIRHVGIGSTVPLPPSDVLDDVQLSKWVIDCDTVDKNEELFLYNKCIARRDDLCSLAPGELVTVDKALVERFSKALEAGLALSPYTDLRDVRLLFFPMLQSNHYYLLCVDFFSSRFHIIDNTTRIPSTKSKYGHIPDNLLLLLAGYFRSLKHLAKAEWCLHFEPKRMTMKWRDANNTIDCGVYLMRHMESYAGQLGLGWDCGLVNGDQATLDRFRLQYIQDICTANINSHRTSNVARAIQYLSSLGDTRNVVVDDQLEDIFEIPRSQLDYSTNNPESPELTLATPTYNSTSTSNPESTPSTPDSLSSGPESPEAASEPSTPNPGGLESYIFTLYIRHGGRIEQSIPPKYLGGKVKIFNGIDSDEWGFICLKEKFAELGYKEGNFRFFSVVEDCLVELLSDSETLNVANSVIRPQLVEVWVVQSSSAEYEEDEIIEEGYIGESEDELVSVDEESSANEYEEDNVDNLEVELGDVNDEVNLSDERPIPGSDAGRVDDNDGNAQIEADIAENAHTKMQEEIPIHTQPDFEYETQVDSGNTSLFEIPVDSDQSLIVCVSESVPVSVSYVSSLFVSEPIPDISVTQLSEFHIHDVAQFVDQPGKPMSGSGLSIPVSVTMSTPSVSVSSVSFAVPPKSEPPKSAPKSSPAALSKKSKSITFQPVLLHSGLAEDWKTNWRYVSFV
nr:ulp1 protease family, C-terminal catalytic domain-containing protein [Ipomoea batatas]